MDNESTKSTQIHQMKEHICDLLLKDRGNNEYYFDDAVKVKATPHTPDIFIHAVSIAPNRGIWLLTSELKWSELEPSDINYTLVLTSLYQRITLLFKTQKAA